MKAKKPEKTFELVPAGNHVARLYQIIHIGTNSFEYMGETKKSDKVRLTFELCDEKKVFKEGEEPRPFSVSREFGLTMGKKSNLRPFVEGIIGTSLSDDEAYEFDLDELVGRACLLNVVHEEGKNGNTYSNIHSASPLPKSLVAPEMANAPKIIDVDTATAEEIEALPDFIKDKMKSSEEYQYRFNPNYMGDAINDSAEELVEEEKPAAPESLARQNRPKVVKAKLEAEEELDGDEGDRESAIGH